MAYKPEGKNRTTKLEQMKEKLSPLKLPARPSPIEVLDKSHLPSDVVEILQKQNVEKIWFLPNTKHYKLDLITNDPDWNSFILVKLNN